ncbi:unnamed protein product [Mytilus coruscus]|uniref:SWIM-type domain-containing protein n=1 Tax=Mytilus coruscus TaxID=42192 RepID=A0A6J8BA87_MYTCO|nr:unnamed protein product [Mytilus coruscus]
MPTPRNFSCIICMKTHLKETNRRAIFNSGLRKYVESILKRHVYEHDAICLKCRTRIQREIQANKLVNNVTVAEKIKAMKKNNQSLEASLSKTIQLPICSTTKSHRMCIVCKKQNSNRHKLIVVPNEAKTQTFIDKGIFISSNSRCCSDHLVGNNEDTAVLILDGTYIYIQKVHTTSSRRKPTVCTKNRPLVKPMIIVGSDGYILSVLGPYYANAHNNDASITKHLFKTNAEDIKQWIKDDDVLVVDRGFRDAQAFLESLNLKVEMPCFIKKGQKQHTTEEANSSRLITKVRAWPNYADRAQLGNQVQKYVEDNNLIRKKAIYSEVNGTENVLDFPKLTLQQIRDITMGVYQLKQAPRYTESHLSDNNYMLQTCRDRPNLLRVKLTSRHSSSRVYSLWIEFSGDEVTGWYCTCKVGARVVGCCAHIASTMWYLGYSRWELETPSTCKYADSILNAKDVSLETDSDSDSDGFIEEWLSYSNIY